MRRRRTDVRFDSAGTSCARVALPARTASRRDVPCVILAHGFSAVRDQRLDAFAERFAAAGLAALVFDYRHFGDSDGEPRQLVDLARQLDDWRAAIAFARSLDGVDRGADRRLGRLAERRPRDDACGARSDGSPRPSRKRRSPTGSSRCRRSGSARRCGSLREGLRDQLRALRGRPPHLIPVVGPRARCASSARRAPSPASARSRRRRPHGATRWRLESLSDLGAYRPARHAQTDPQPDPLLPRRR